jgi:putative PIN family toxin of toxin-antitoxin system
VRISRHAAPREPCVIETAPLIVLDTMVVVSGIIGKRSGSDARTLEAIDTGRVRLALSDAWLRELTDVLGREFMSEHDPEPGRAFRAGLTLGLMGTLFRPERLDWVTLRDHNDWWLLDLAYASGADCIVTRDRRVLEAATQLGFDALMPPAFLEYLDEH